MENFDFGGHVIRNKFVNREKEQRQLENNFLSGINTVLISPRRMGKSSLLAQMQIRMKKHKNIRFCYVDMFSIRSEQEFYEILSAKIIESSISKWDEAQILVKNFLKTLIPKLAFTVGEETSIELSFDSREIKKHSGEILDMAEKIAKQKKIKLVICLDEFQNISYFDKDGSFQKKLRAYWQKHQSVTYCMYGSKRHMMSELFQNSEMPFYRFGDIMTLDKIDMKHWIPFIQKIFTANKKKIPQEIATEIVTRMDNRPYYVQQFGKEVLAVSGKNVGLKDLDKALEEILKRNNIFYQNEIDNLPSTQINFLKAIVAGRTQFTSAATLQEFKLGSVGNVRRAKDALRAKNIMDDFGNKIELLDPVFQIWFSRNFLSRHRG